MANIPSRSERLAEFYRRLGAAPAASDADEAYSLLCDTLNEVEDDMTGIPFDPTRWRTDGRMYPPQSDRMSIHPDRPDLRYYYSRGHDTLIGANGAIEIRDRAGNVVFAKPGADGKMI